MTGTGPLGCVPAELAMRGNNGGCSAELQHAASLYNPQLVQMLNQLNREAGRTVFIAANTQQMHDDFVSNPQAFGNSAFNNIFVLYYIIYIMFIKKFKPSSLSPQKKEKENFWF